MLRLAGFAHIARALSEPNYGTYTAGSAISLIGTWMQRVAVGWLTWQLTESGAWLGAVAFADLFPTVLVGPVAGALADRWDRLRVTKVSQALAMLQSLVLFGLTATDRITIEVLLVLTVWLGIVSAFNQPARLALIPSLVRRENLTAAVATNSIIFNLARFIGPAAAGAVIVTGGIAAAFALNAASFAVFLAALSRIRLRDGDKGRRRGGQGVLRDIGEGVRYAATHPGIAPLLLLLVVVCIGARPFVELLPGFAGEVFGAGAAGLALLTSTVGVGAVAGGLWLAQRGDVRGLTGVVLVSSIVLALALLLFAATDRLWFAVPAVAVAGFCMVACGVGIQTQLQIALDSAMRGRVLGLYGLVFRGGPAIGALAMGLGSEAVGLGRPLALGALATLGFACWTWRRRRAMADALEAARPLP